MTLDAGCALQGLGTALKNTGGKGRPAEKGRPTLSQELPCLFQWFGFVFKF